MNTSWEKTAKMENDLFSTINNQTVVYYQYDFLNKSGVAYGGEPQPVYVTSFILDLSEQERILLSIIESEN